MQSTRSGSDSKPSPDFPLWAHPSGRWCKKVRGKFRYFGRVQDDPDGQAALKLWEQQKDDLLEGREPAKPQVAGKQRAGKPDKPYDGFPMFAHDSGRWAKKIRGRLHYFGSWRDDRDGSSALERFNREWPYLKDGRTPPPAETGDALTVAALADEFLNAKRRKLHAGELSEASFADYYATCALLVDHFGKDRRVDDLRPADFAKLRESMAARWGTVTLRNEINRIRIILKYASDERLIDRPIHFGQSFQKPSAKALRKARHESGERMFEAHELRTILEALDGNGKDTETGKALKADPILKAMVLLGINAGFGNNDVASLPQPAVDLKNGWIDFPRPKTEIPRRVPLWAETVEALREAIAKRPAPKDDTNSDLCFLSVQGNPWVRVAPKRGDQAGGRYVRRDNIANRFGRLLKRLGINGRNRLGFYALRHTFETVAGESRDQVAVDSIMGHVDNSMAGLYRERISDDRLRDAVETVRMWLWPPKQRPRKNDRGRKQKPGKTKAKEAAR